MKKSGYTLAQAAEEYGIPATRIRGFCAEGVIGVKVGTQWWVSDDEMRALYERLRDEAREEAGLR